MTTEERRLRLVHMLWQVLAAPDEDTGLTDEIREFVLVEFDSSDYSDPDGTGQALDEIVYASEMVGVPDGYRIWWGGLLAHYRHALDSLEQRWGLGGAPGNSTSSAPDR